MLIEAGGLVFVGGKNGRASGLNFGESEKLNVDSFCAVSPVYKSKYQSLRLLLRILVFSKRLKFYIVINLLVTIFIAICPYSCRSTSTVK